MKTLYININGEDIQSSQDIVVVGTPDDTIVDKFYYELGKEIVKGVDAPGIRSLAKHIVINYKDKDEMSFGKITEQWLKVKDKLLGENPTGTETIELPMEYVKWLQNYGDTIYTEIAKSLYTRNRLVEISLDKIYRNSVNIIINSIEPDKYGQFVVNDEVVTDDSAISIAIMKKFDGIAFKPYKKEDVCPKCGHKPCDCRKQKIHLDHIFGFSEGISLVCVKEKYGYINTLGELVIPCTYDFAGWFREGVAPVCKNGKYGYIDKSGGQVIPFLYDKANSFYEGLAVVKIKRIWKFIDKCGNIKITLPYDIGEYGDAVLSFYNGYSCILSKNGKWGAVNKNGKLIIPFKYDSPFFIDENGIFSAAIKYPHNWGIRNIDDGEIIQAGYHEINPFSEGLAASQKKTMWGYIDRTGKKRIDSIYEDAKMFSEDVAPVKLNNKWGYIDKIGTFVISNIYDEACPFSEGLAAVCLNGKWGFTNKKDICIPCVFEWVEPFHEGFARVRYKNSECIINQSGEIVIPNGVTHFD